MYLCKACKTPHREWTAQCPTCSAWNTIYQTTPVGIVVGREDDGAPLTIQTPQQRRRIPIVHHTAHEIGETQGDPDSDLDACELPIPITEVSREHVPRFITNIPALDHVLGGGLVPGGSVLIGGIPGSGKTSLIMQAAASCARWNEARVLYATAEENLGQMADRAERIGANFERLYVIRESDPDRILRSAEKIEPEVLIVDSISTLARIDLPAMPGSVTQVRACAELLHAWCQERHIALILIGHVTKDGAVAGPNTLKHLVDAVLHLDLIEGSQLRVLRAHKNRYGDTGAVGRFMMSKDGLESVGGYRDGVEYETVSTSMDIEMRGAMADAYRAAETPSMSPGGTIDAYVSFSPMEVRADPPLPNGTPGTSDREPQATDSVVDPPDSLS